MTTAVFPAASRKARASRYWACLRPWDILVLQGSPLLGAAVAWPHPTAELVAPLAILMVANLCLVAHIFVLNDWCNLTADLTDPLKAPEVFIARGVGYRQMGALAGGLLLVSLLLFSRLGPGPLYIAMGIAGLSVLYSLPPFDWKGHPLLNSAAHLAGGVLHFLLGYSLGNALDGRGVTIATFFAVTFAAGHLTQELQDHHGDVQNGIRTNAVTFGQRHTFAASVALFTLSHALLLFLAVQGMLPRALAALVVLYPLHLRWSRHALAEGLTSQSIGRLRSRYRVLYAVIGLSMLAALWLE